MTFLTLVRHGETEWNLERRIQGTTDVPLNDTGREQARTTALRLAAAHDQATPPLVISSDLSRAQETASIIAATIGADAPRVYAELRERDYGDAEGTLVDEFFSRFGNWHDAVIPGAEPSEVLRARAIGALRTVVREARRDAGSRGAHLLVVSHGAVIREVIRHASGDTLPLPGERLMNGSAHRLLLERDSIRLLAYEGVAAVPSQA